MPKRIAITGLVILMLAAGGAWAWRLVQPHATKSRVAVINPTRGEFVISLFTEGTLQADDSIAVQTGKAPGELTMIVSDGAMVKAGEVFCRIESRELQRKLTDAELADKQAREEIAKTRESAQERLDTDQRSLDQSEKDYTDWQASVGTQTKQAEAQLAFDEAEATRLKLEYSRSQRLATKGYQSGAEADVAKASYEAQEFKVGQSKKALELTRRQIESQRQQKTNQVTAARQRVKISAERISGMVQRSEKRAEVTARQLALVRTALEDTVIKAPVAGTVSLTSTYQGGERRAWREGDQVSTGTTLGSIAGGENLSVRCRIKEADIAALKKGQRAEVEFEALAGRRFPGTVSTVGVVAREVFMFEDPNARANERVFDVPVKVEQTAARRLKPGLNARVRITLQRIPNVLSVPLDAVFDREDKSYVFVKQGESFVRREVKTGERNEVAVVVRSGLSAGETVALSDPTRAPEAKARKSG
jgi:HlyD family secretion protein